MARPTPDWIRRNTTAEDLLDDGVENASDLASVRGNRMDDVEPANPDALEIRRSTLERVRQDDLKHVREERKRSINRIGLLLGIVFLLAGLWLVLYPADAYVVHARIKLPTVIEHVTKNASMLYGAALFVFGLIVCAYSLHRPRMDGN